MKMIKLTIQFGIILMFSSCKNEEPVDLIGTPEFVISGSIDGELVEWEAGEEKSYLFTSFSAENVYKFSSVLKGTNCSTNCPSSIGIVLSGTSTSNLFNAIEEQISVTQNYSYLINSQTYLHYSIGGGNDFENITWTINGNATGNESDGFMQVIPNDFVQINFSGKLINQSIIELNKSYQVGTRNIGNCPQDILIQEENGVIQASIPNGNGMYNWSLGGLSLGSGMSKDILLQEGDLVEVCVSDNSCTRSSCQEVKKMNQQLVSISTDQFLGFDEFNIELFITDKNGTKFSSLETRQDATAYFRLLSVDAYTKNENGLSTVKVSFEAKVNVANLTDKKPVILQGDIAFAYDK